MGFVSKIKETFRDKTREKVCAVLCSTGVDARTVERGAYEERIGLDMAWGRWYSLGLMEIHGSPIRWVNVCYAPAKNQTVYRNIYIVPDPTMDKTMDKYDEFEAESIRVRSVPLIGKVVRIRWEGRLPDGLFRRLEEDAWLNQTLIKLKEDIKIHNRVGSSYWAISHREYAGDSSFGFLSDVRTLKEVQWAELWDCCTAIAHYLLGPSSK